MRRACTCRQRYQEGGVNSYTRGERVSQKTVYAATRAIDQGHATIRGGSDFLGGWRRRADRDHFITPLSRTAIEEEGGTEGRASKEQLSNPCSMGRLPCSRWCSLPYFCPECKRYLYVPSVCFHILLLLAIQLLSVS